MLYYIEDRDGQDPVVHRVIIANERVSILCSGHNI